MNFSTVLMYPVTTEMNAKIEQRIGRNIRILRESQGMTQETLAAKLQLEGCDITRSAVAKIEVGQRHLYPDERELLQTHKFKHVHVY